MKYKGKCHNKLVFIYYIFSKYHDKFPLIIIIHIASILVR